MEIMDPPANQTAIALTATYPPGPPEKNADIPGICNNPIISKINIININQSIFLTNENNIT